jgi:hypothetical protein
MQMEKILEIIRSRGIKITDDSEVDKKDIKTLKDLLDAGINCLFSSHPRAAFIIAAKTIYKQYHHNEQPGQKVNIIGPYEIETDLQNLGVTGVGFVDDPKGKRWYMPQVGGLIINKNCFIGSGVRIRRAYNK